eukprot:COSAG02_NODE_12823_length_1487_cov_1.574207_2_plen_109_part_00
MRADGGSWRYAGLGREVRPKVEPPNVLTGWANASSVRCCDICSCCVAACWQPPSVAVAAAGAAVTTAVLSTATCSALRRRRGCDSLQLLVRLVADLQRLPLPPCLCPD